MKRIFTLFFMLTLLFSAFSQQSNCPPTVTDRNGNVYYTIWVGGNCWMKENLRSTLYGTQSNADHLQPVYMVYPGASSTMGYLYTWYSAVGLPQGSTATPPTAISERVQGICPNEWAIPSAIQLMSLINSGDPRIGDIQYWVYNNGITPLGTSNFDMLPSGFYNAHFERFVEYNHAGYLWTLNYNGTTSTCGIFPFDCRNSDQMNMNKNSLLSVRCVKAPPYGVEEITACDSITWNGVTRYTTGRYVANLPNDSVSTLLLTVNYTTYYTLPVVACDSYTWDLTGDTYTTSGTDVAVITNALGCDSVVTLDLEVRYSNTGVDVQNHCDSYTWIDGITYTESTNTPTFVVTNAAGCDSTVTLNLTIRKMTTGIDVQNHCDSYTWIDGNTYTESTNEPTFVLTNAVGCDSVVTLNLTIRKKTYGIDVQDHCDSYTWINGVTYTESTNDPVYTITNEAGCDSIVTLNLTIRKKTASPSQSLTEYNTYTWNGQTYTTSGIYTATLVNAVGCDSTATLDLTILYRYPITFYLNGATFSGSYPENYIYGIGATLPIPVKPGSRFDGWFDNAEFTGSPITSISNSEQGDRTFYALWTITSVPANSYLTFAGNTTSTAIIPDNVALNPTTALTLEAWIYPTVWRTSVFQGSIIAKEQSTGNAGYVLRCGTTSGTLSFAIGTGTTFSELTASGLVLNQWQHVAATFDGTTMRIFRNGVQIGSKAQTGTIAVSANPVEIGRNPQYSDRYFQGHIDEARIFNVALDATTIQSWYNKSVNNTHGNYANLVGYYEFDNTTDPSAVIGTIGANGTVTGATYNSGCNFAFTSNSTVIAAPSKISVSHPTTAIVIPGDNNIQILKVDVSTSIVSSLTQITFTTNGTTNAADITNARLFYTGSSNTFATTTAFGTVTANPNGTFTFTGNQPLTCGNNVFWLTYDISPTATFNNVVDATVVNATVERLLITPTDGAPTGNRRIADACIHTLQLRDTYGDTWNGGSVSLYVNNTLVYANITVSTSVTTFINFPFAAEPGDTIRVIRTAAGSYPGEMRIQILGGNGPIILAEIQPVDAPGQFAVAACYFNITSSTGLNGTIAPLGTIGVLKGGSQTFTITPDLGYMIQDVLVNGVSNSSAISSGSYTFSNVQNNQTISASFYTNSVVPTLITLPTTGIAYEGTALSTVTFSGGLVEYEGVAVPGTFVWKRPTYVIPTSGTITDTVRFIPNVLSSYLPFTFPIQFNALPLSVTVAGTGTSTTNANIPFYGLYMDANQNNYILFPDSMMTGLVGKTLTSMTFYTTTPASGVYNSNVTIKLGPTSLLEVPATGTVAFTPTTVFTGKVSIIANQVVITFTTPYLYTGGNLIFEFNSVASNYISATFTGVARTNTSRRTQGTSTVRYSFIPKTKFNFLP